MAFEVVKQNLLDHGFQVSVFADGAEAAAYLNACIDGKTVGFGGSITLRDLGLYEKLKSHNTVYWHMLNGDLEECVPAASAEVYLTSANGLAETGEIINIDGIGNRVASGLYGHRKVYFVIGRNKLAPTYEEALWRARNIAAPKNAQRKQVKTPCAIKCDRCYNCKSPERICRGLTVHWRALTGMEMEVALIDEDLGY